MSLLGVMLGQGFFFACVTLLGRVEGPAALGQFNAWLAIGTLAGTLAVLRYELACVTNSPEKAFESLIHVVALATGLAALVSGTLFSIDATRYLVVVVFALSLIVQTSGTLFLNSLRRYYLIFFCKLIVNVAFLVWMCCAINFRLSEDAFEVYSLIYLIISCFTFLCLFLNGRQRGYSFKLRLSFYVEHARYPVYTLPSTILGSVLLYALSLVVPRWYGPEQAGYFAVAYRFGVFPVSLIGQSIGGVFRRDAIGVEKSTRQGMSLQAIYGIYGRGLLLVAVLYVMTVQFLCEPVVHWLFGARWGGATEYLRILMPLFALQIIYVPLSQVFIATRRQRLDFGLQLLMATMLGVALFVVHVYEGSLVTMLVSFASAGAACTLVGLFFTSQASHSTRRDADEDHFRLEAGQEK